MRKTRSHKYSLFSTYMSVDALKKIFVKKIFNVNTHLVRGEHNFIVKHVILVKLRNISAHVSQQIFDNF